MQISITKAQNAFNSAIKRRDCRCMVRDYEPCNGQLECSHFFKTSSASCLRFYPPNAYAQCQKHHYRHHNGNINFYHDFMMSRHPSDFVYMNQKKHCIIKYTDELLKRIITLCNADKLDELAGLIEDMLR